MKLSRIWRILQIKETWSKICIIHHILWKLNSIALLFNIQNIFKLLKEKMSSLFFCSPKITKPHPQVFLVNGSIICSSLHFWHHFDVFGSIICSELHFWHHFDIIGSIICSRLYFWHHFEVIGSIICSRLHFWHHFHVISSIFCSGLHFLHHWFHMTKFVPNLVSSSWLRWIIQYVVLTSQKLGNILNA